MSFLYDVKIADLKLQIVRKIQETEATCSCRSVSQPSVICV